MTLNNNIIRKICLTLLIILSIAGMVAAAPTITSVETSDKGMTLGDNISGYSTSSATENNGQIDQLNVTFDEPVYGYSFNKSDFSIPNNSYSIDALKEGLAKNDSIIHIDLEESGNIDTEITPTVEYTQGSGENTTGGVIPSQTFSNTEDGAAPILEEFEAEPGFARASLIFSEKVTSTSDNPLGAVNADSYTNGNGDGASDMTGITHTNESDFAIGYLDKETLGGTLNGDISNDKVNLTDFKDLNGNEVTESVATMSDSREEVTITTGWRLFSTPSLQNKNTSEILSGVSYSSILSYDNNQWITDISNIKLGEMDAIYINSTENQEIVLEDASGVQNIPPTKDLEEGWNLVGPTFGGVNESEVFNSVIDSTDGDNGLSQTYCPPKASCAVGTNTGENNFENSVPHYEGLWLYMDTAEELAGLTV